MKFTVSKINTYFIVSRLLLFLKIMLNIYFKHLFEHTENIRKKEIERE